MMLLYGSVSINLSIHYQRQQIQEGNPDIPHPNDTPQLLLGDPKIFAHEKRYMINPACSGSAPGLVTVGHA